ncbi:hypothetical protein Tco_0668570 [Tanacetum coccineum]
MGCYCLWRSSPSATPVPKTTKQLAAKKNQERVKSILLLAIPNEYLLDRNKPDIDEIDIDDLYNNLRVYEDEMKRSSSSTSTSQNLAFLFSENTSSTNEVSTASGDFGVSTAGGISQVSSTPCAHIWNESREKSYGTMAVACPTNESSSAAWWLKMSKEDITGVMILK